jgi:hypothetical protein
MSGEWTRAKRLRGQARRAREIAKTQPANLQWGTIAWAEQREEEADYWLKVHAERKARELKQKGIDPFP